MTEHVAVEPVTMHEALVVRLYGDLTPQTSARVADSLRSATAPLPTPHLLAIDLRELDTLTAAGIRMLHDLARSVAERGVRCCIVFDPLSTVARAVRIADPQAVVPQFTDLEEALSAPLVIFAGEGQPEGRNAEPA